MPQELSEKQKKYLRGLAHGKDPVILIGSAGLSPGVAREFDDALGAHELVKVRARVGDREQRDAILAELATQSGSSLVQRIGNVGVFYRPHKEKPKIILPGD
ncbi:MAG: ribosome assembly RNA-binding protein YhbY [Pseudomonadota bacterium]|nr:ribosome assembly RNA-binding protein YhbY [Pseudomonadota bacterium]